MADITALVESLHPLEIKVLTALSGLGPQPSPPPVLSDDQIAQTTGLERSQVSMAVEWLLTKSMLRVESETITPMVSLTAVGERYFEKYSPVERVLSAVREAGQIGKRLTIKEIQTQEELEPTETSSAVGCLKKEGAIRIAAGAC